MNTDLSRLHKTNIEIPVELIGYSVNNKPLGMDCGGGTHYACGKSTNMCDL